MTAEPATKARAGATKVSPAVQKALDLLQAGGDGSHWEQLSDTAVQAHIVEYRGAVADVSEELESLGIESADLDSQDRAGNSATGTGGHEQARPSQSLLYGFQEPSTRLGIKQRPPSLAPQLLAWLQEAGEGCTLGSVDDLDPSEWQVIVISLALSKWCLGLEIMITKNREPSNGCIGTHNAHFSCLMSGFVDRSCLTVA